jgi:DNA-binding NarL/FixJ family response regulator
MSATRRSHESCLSRRRGLPSRDRDEGAVVGLRSPQTSLARRSPRCHPAGLTERQAEILALLGSGATNAEIAARLVLSVRTVDHHVSAVLQKLGVTSRREAVLAGRSVRNGSR